MPEAYLKAPFPYFGGKSRVADIVWRAIGADVPNYVEPFLGSAAVLLARPDGDRGIETVNDKSGFLANFWRAIQHDPEAVAHWADYPVSEIDLHARHAWLVNRKQRLVWCLEDPDFYDPKIAGWWVWGMCAWIGGGFCSGEGPWVSNGAHIVDLRQELAVGEGIKRRRPHLGNAGMGIHRRRPHLGDAGMGINRQLPHLRDAGRGINRKHAASSRHEYILDWFQALSERLRDVRICCGDWSRVCGPTPTTINGVTGVFLDPPYSAEAERDMEIYEQDCGDVAHAVREWAIANGNNPKFRIVLAGYEGEHDMPPDWRVLAWETQGGYGNLGADGSRGRANARRERLWFSPHCLDAQDPQHHLFQEAEHAIA